MKGYTHPVWVCGYGCVWVWVSLRVYAGKTCWQKSVQVCFVNAVCSGVMHAVRACVCVWELEHVCSLCELLGHRPSCSPLLEGVGCHQWPRRQAYGPSLGFCEVERNLWFLWPLRREQPVRQKACQLQFSFTNHLHRERAQNVFLAVFNSSIKVMCSCVLQGTIHTIVCKFVVVFSFKQPALQEINRLV